jgi:signal transduction histidine kinase/CheY-like chemotaxis protein
MSEAPTLAQPARSDHRVRFYDDDVSLTQAVTRYLGDGLARGESAMVVATAEHRIGLQQQLEATGLDVGTAMAAGRLVLLDPQETLARATRNGELDWEGLESSLIAAVERGVAASPARRVRTYGEMVDHLWRQGRQAAALRLEDCGQRLAATHPVSMLCAYHLGSFGRESDAEGFRQVCALHQHVIPEESFPAGADEGTRRREVATLQQRARALETELKRSRALEAQLRSAREQAESATHAKDQFLAALSHELRNPLAPILTALEVMKLRGDGQIKPARDVILRQTRHLMRLVDDLLDISSVTRGTVELRRGIVDLRDVLDKAIEITRPLLGQPPHRFVVDAPGRGVLVMADEARLAQAIANLLTNSATYTPPSGHVQLAARREGSEAIIEVRDDGMGIDDELLPRVFDVFVQGRQELDRPAGGLGVGLALVRGMVELHGGTVSAQSAGPGKGSVFTVRLPALDVATVAPGREPRAEGPARSRRVLLVDDNEDALLMLAEMLRESGHEVITAADGPAALELVRQQRPEVAILDIGLPAMDGYELARRIRAELADAAPRLIALTGYGRESDQIRSREAGFALHLVKPLEASMLLECLG